jgi:hypothetical protein
MQHSVEGNIERHKPTMFQSRLGSQQPVPWVTMIPVEACRQLGMQIGDSQGLQSACRDRGTQFLRLKIELSQPHLVVEFVKSHGAHENRTGLVLDDRLCRAGEAIATDRPLIDRVAVEQHLHCGGRPSSDLP